jgi:hypothetical protein
VVGFALLTQEWIIRALLFLWREKTAQIGSVTM